MGSEYFINSQELEDKVRDLLPSQGGSGAGFDLSASTQIIPIIDLTESAQGSNLRQDLQSSLSFNSATPFSVNGATSTIINNTGYFRIFGVLSGHNPASGTDTNTISITDGISSKNLIEFKMLGISGNTTQFVPFDFIVFSEAGDSVTVTASATDFIAGSTRQIASINGTLINP